MEVCGRYYVEIDENELRDIVDAVMKQEEEHQEQLKIKLYGEMFPTDFVPVQTGIGQFQAMKWGYASASKRPVINARSETALTKPMFLESMKLRRCLVPASGYYEWKKEGSRKVKHKIYIPRQPMFMAGCYRQEPGNLFKSFVILTRAAAGDLEEIHGRMPVIIPRSCAKNWLHGGPDAMNNALTELAFEQAT
ncbi:MAG: SOS response-associated peptidase [Clostridiales bacterium]|nr:SOS response-associated peptidase [Clostridiales bacterium]